MTVDWQVSKSTRTCAATGREIQAGEEYFSALREEEEGFVRYDYSAEAWQDVSQDGFFSFWRTTLRPEEERKRLIIDTEAFYTFFCNLNDPQGDAQKELFRYLVALILTRKRILRLDDIDKTAEGDFLVLYDRRLEQTTRVFCPPVTETQLAEAQESLNQIFECQIDSSEDL